MRAYLMFKSKEVKDAQVINKIRFWLRQHENTLFNSNWTALPELTNENGSFCRDSCPSQAWSFATLLDTLYDIRVVENAK